MPIAAGGSGYAHSAYVASLRHLGEPLHLRASGGWLLRRPIPNSHLHDGAGPYPLFLCARWPGLVDDLTELRSAGLVSVTIVPDPFGACSPELLASTFDVVRVVKQRWIVDLTGDIERAISPHHRRRAEHALARTRIERCVDPRRHAGEWSRCYRAFAVTRGMTGAAAFPEQSLVAQLSVPGLVMYRAVSGGGTIGFSLWMVHAPYAYGHLAAYTNEGRQAGVAYACYWEIFRDLRTLGVEHVDLGGGLDDDDGLARWKSGWTPESRPSLLCGAMLRPVEYGELARARGATSTPYFPAYRAPAAR